MKSEIIVRPELGLTRCIAREGRLRPCPQMHWEGEGSGSSISWTEVGRVGSNPMRQWNRGPFP